MSAGLLIIWLQLNVSGFRLVLARGWHGHADRMQTSGTVLVAAEPRSVQGGPALWSYPHCVGQRELYSR